MKYTLILLFTFLLLVVKIEAQQVKDQLDILLNKNILQPGDSLVIKVDYRDVTGKIRCSSMSTLQLIIENEQGQRTGLRWPVINGKASGALYLPDSLPHGKYKLLAGLQNRFFSVTGKIQNAKNTRSIQALLLTKDGDWDEQDVTVAPDGSFAIRNWLFQDNALMAFSDSKNNNLNIQIRTQLDSSYATLAVAGKAFYIGNPSAASRSALNDSVEITENDFADQGSILPAVIVRTSSKTPAEQYNDEYVKGLFVSGDARLISIMDEPGAAGFPNIFSYLQGRIAGLQITPGGINGGAARWRGSPVAFFLDEIRVSAQQISTVPMTDIAIVKAYPPPFFGAAGGAGGIAVYTRRGGESNFLPANKQVFKVRGYTPLSTVLKF